MTVQSVKPAFFRRLAGKLIIAFFSFVLYIPVFIVLYPLLGPGTASIITIPVLVTAGLMGIRAGLAASIMAFPLNTLLLNMAGVPGWDAIAAENGLAPMFSLFIISVVVGLLHDLRERIVRELAERRKAEEALRESEAGNRALLDIIPDLMLHLAPDGTLVSCRSPGPTVLADLDDASPGKNIAELFPGELAAAVMTRLSQVRVDDEIRIFRYRHAAAGAERDFDVRIVGRGGADAIVMIRDITEQAREEEMRKRENLLKEIHHRVKNNMQIISSLLYLQASETGDERYRELIQETRDRIRTMALIHEKLYQSDDFANIDAADYLSGLAHDLFESCGAAARSISLDLHLERIFLGMDAAIPCGLIVNELLSNAFKHAFPGERTGRISCALSALHGEKTAAGPGKRTVELAVSDDGVGFPAALDPARAATLGLRIVGILVKQLKGSLDVRRTGGVAFTIRFPLEESR